MRSPFPIALLACATALAIGSSCILDRAGGLDPNVEGTGASGAGGGGTGGSTPECTEVADCGAITDCTTGWECTDSVCVPDHASPGSPCTGALGQKVCNGSGTCVQCNGGVDCADGTCSDNLEFQMNGAQCVDEVCKPVGESADCKPYKCSEGNCLDTCTSNSDCFDPQDICDLGTCGPLRPLGAPCENSTACESTYCADGVCCNEDCNTQCEGCTAMLTGLATDGTCDSIEHGVDDPDMSCGFGFGCLGDGNCTECDDPVVPLAGGACPPACDSCSGGNTCNFVCDSANACANAMINCPTGWDCDVDCSADSACLGATINCPPGRDCLVTCTNPNQSCANATITCMNGPCTVDCKNGSNDNCLNTAVTCGANSCDVKCAALNQPVVMGSNNSCLPTEDGECTN